MAINCKCKLLVLLYEINCQTCKTSLACVHSLFMHLELVSVHPWHVPGGDTDSFPKCCCRQTDNS